ncbi:hypothetical protein [Gracilimonas sp.]|uniref:hypothetical protein n=1 Tax=Gracilimonas sp. TaxID=1974203 RepID=UPI0028712D1D|nr:hypothetical protein [Gracilimonas sp.]
MVREYPNQWMILLNGFKKSAKQNTNAKINVHQLPEITSRKRKELVVNSYKLKKWAEIVRNAENPLVLCDSDLCFLDDIEDGFTDKPITLTKRTLRWCNAGVVFVRPCKEANEFFDRWVEMDTWLHDGDFDSRGNPLRLKKAWRKTGIKGQNQTALAKIKNEFEFGWVDGQVYNASQKQEWHGTPKVVHVKDSLRNDLFRNTDRYELTNKIKPFYK